MVSHQDPQVKLNNDFFAAILPTLESANYHVARQNGSLVIQFDGEEALQLEIEIHSSHDDPQCQIVHFVLPIGVDIPDPYWISAAKLIADANRQSPLGEFSISETSQPYFDYRFIVNTRGEFSLNLLEAIQMSFVVATRFLDKFQTTLREWLQMKNGLTPQIA